MMPMKKLSCLNRSLVSREILQLMNKMKVFSKRIITLFICAILLVTTCFISAFAGVDFDNGSTKTTFTKGNKVVFEGDSQIVAQCDKYNLVCNKEPVAFSLINSGSVL